MQQTPQGLSDPVSFGSPRPNVSTVSTLNEQDLSLPPDTGWTSPIVTYTVANPRPVVRGESDAGAIVMEGDATGLNNLAGLGLLNTDSAIYYAGTLATNPSRLHSLASQGAHLVVTDTNRKQAFRWDTLTANAGYTETPGDNPAKTDLSDSPIELFPGSTNTSKTYAQYTGAVNVTASSYGNGVSYTPEDRAYSAIDGNFDTAWITGTFVPDPAGQWWQAQFANPVTTDHINLVQPQRGDRSRWISGVTLTFDGKHPMKFHLTASSHVTSGQTLTFPAQTFHTLRIRIDGTTDNTAPPLTAAAVGFSEVQIPGQQVREVLQMPTQMLSTLASASASDRLTVVMTRSRTSQYPPRSDPETSISRQFTLPTARTFTLSGSASLSALIPDDEIDRLVGRAANGATGVRDAYSSGRLPGDVNATASATVDGNPSTAWQPGLGTKAQIGSTLTYDLTKPQKVSVLNMQVIADGRHSVPTSMTITSGDQTRHITLPPIADSNVPGAVTTVPVPFPADDRVALRRHLHRHPARVRRQLLLGGPLGVAAGHRRDRLPGRAVFADARPAARQLRRQPDDHRRPTDRRLCRRVDRSSALGGGQVQLVPCGPDAKGITLAAGTHVVETAIGHNGPCAIGPVDLHRLEHRPARARLGRRWRRRGRRPPPPRGHARARGDPARCGAHRDAHVRRTSTATRLLVTGATATVRARARPERQQGMAGRRVARTGGARRLARGGPGAAPARRRVRQRLARHAGRPQGARRFVVHRPLTWTPQRLVWAALAVSGATLLLCLVLGFLPIRARRWVRSKLPRRLRGPAGPDAPERPDRPFDLPAFALPWSNPPVSAAPPGLEGSGDRWPWWRRIARAVIIGAVTGGVALLVTRPLAGLGGRRDRGGGIARSVDARRSTTVAGSRPSWRAAST